MKLVLQCFVLIICMLLSSSNSYSGQAFGNVKVLNPEIYKQPRLSSPNFIPERPSPYDESSLSQKQHERLELTFGKSFTRPQQTSPMQTNPQNTFQHQIDGDWDYVVGQVGFFHNFPSFGSAFVSIIGLRTTPAEDGNHTTQEWDRKAFWFDVGDGIPMHLNAEYSMESVDPDDASDSVFVYNSYNLLYRQKDKDYSQSELDGEWITLEIITNFDQNILDYNIFLLDENDEVVDIRKFEMGDEVESWTSVFKFDEPDSIYLTTMEEDFRTVQSEPVFTYEHLTPNVDFPNSLTAGLIDFTKIDLQLALLGVNEEENTEIPVQFSTVKDLGLKWDGTVTTSVTDWFSNWFN